MRLLLTLLMALAFAMLPLAGASHAEAPPQPCHEPAPQDDPGVACAEHCMTLIAAVQPAPAAAPSVANMLSAARAASDDGRAPRSGVAPETPPPRR